MTPDEEEPSEFRSPPGPADRAWLHPSEFGKLLPRRHGEDDALAARATRMARNERVRPLAVPLVAGMVGAALMLGVVAVTGNFRRAVQPRPVVQRVFGAVPVTDENVDGAVDIAEAVAPAVVSLRVSSPNGTRTGSALAYRSDGRLITNQQLVADAEQLDVIAGDGSVHKAAVVGADGDTGIAVLACEGLAMSLATFAQKSSVRIGQTAIAVGAPSSPGSGPTVSAGIIAALTQNVDDGVHAYYDMIATNAPAWAVQSGGALVNRNGVVVGLTYVTTSERPAMAIPIDIVRRAADDILAGGHARHAWLGLRAEDLDPATATEYGATSGALVREVTAGSPAAKAGIEVQDVVTTLGADKVVGMAEMLALLRHHQPGESIEVTVLRSGRAKTLKVLLADRPGG